MVGLPGGDVDRNVTITFIGRDNASRTMAGIGSSAGRTSTTVAKLTKALKAMAVVAATALAAAAALAAYAIYDITKAAYEDDIAMKKLARTQKMAQGATKAQTDATADLIDKLELQTGIADDELRPALASLALTGMSVKESQDLLSVAMDVSVAKGKPLQTVADALAKGYNGVTGGLGRLGVKVKDASGDALSFSEILKTLKERTQGAAKAAGRTDPWKRVSAAFHQVKEDLGKGLLPILRKFGRWMIGTLVPWVKDVVVPAFQRFTDWIRNTAVPWIMQKLVPALQDLWKWFKTKVKPALDDLWGAAKKLWGKLQDLNDAMSGEDGTTAQFQSMGDTAIGIIDGLTALANVLATIVGWLQWIEEHGGWLDKLDRLKNFVITGGLSEVGPGGNLQGGNADGGWLKRRGMGGWTMVGEHGPELINDRGFVKTHSQTMGMGGGITININGALDPVAVGRQVESVMAKYRRGTGRAQLGMA